MKSTLIAIACVLSLTSVSAQTTSQWLTPSPMGIAITVGQWLYKDTKKIYAIEVESYGPNLTAAKNEGFRIAIEHAVGSLTSSESKLINGQLASKEIIAYSSGFVEKFEIIERGDDNGKTTVKMKVWVSYSSIADRLLHKSESAGLLNGDQAGASVSTKLEELNTGDKLLKSVLADYPRRAFDIEQKPTRILMDNNRRVWAEVPYTLRWNKTYIRSLEETLEAVSGTPAIYRHTWDQPKFNLLFANFAHSALIKITVKDTADNVLAKHCSFPPASNNNYGWLMLGDGPYQNQFWVYKTAYATTKQYIYLGTDSSLIENANKIELTAVRQSEC